MITMAYQYPVTVVYQPEKVTTCTKEEILWVYY